ncbi:MAG TPA: site-2 protease family protein [Anaerolineae bacterium]|nr:site-2 protease family protein [Anaerolineae bacterium]
MLGGFSLGRIFGINLKIDWSWLLIFLLITWNLSVVFGQVHPDWGLGLSWGTALGASLLFFVSVLAHELAHSLVAQAQGVPVRNITLFLFGGVSNIQRDPPSPRAEFLITIVGPLTSLALGILFLIAGGLMSTGVLAAGFTSPLELAAQFSPLATLLLWLGWINILLAVFNLIPGFPLDGGRVLRSILWAATGSLRRATHWASWVGQVVAWIFITIGIAMIFGVEVPFFGTGLIAGLWLAFIGWFLNTASVQSYQQVVVRDMLEDVPVEALMRTNPPTVPPNVSINELVDNYMMRTDDHAFPVVHEGQLLGMITLDDIRRVPREAWDTTLVREAMTPAEELTLARVKDDAAQALNQLMQRDVRQVPVLSADHHLAGLLRRRDVIKWLQLRSDAI